MAVTKFHLADKVFFVPPTMSAFPFDNVIFQSPDQFNGTGLDYSDGLRTIIDYQDLQSSPANQSFVQAVVEGKTALGDYYILAYEFNEYRGTGPSEAQKAHIIFTPNLFWPDAGVENIVFVGGKTVERISPQPGFLPEVWRVSIVLRDPVNAFISLKFSVYGERFSQLILPNDFRGVISDTDTGNVVTTEIT